VGSRVRLIPRLGLGGPVTDGALIDDAPVGVDLASDNRAMSSTVCCPSCWTWSDLGKRTTCQRCGAALILPDGRSVETAHGDPPPPPPPPTAFGFAGVPAVATQSGFSGGSYQLITTPSGTDWVAICRWITIGYGLLVVLGLMGVGLLVQHINVPISDPNTGLTTVQTFNIGPAFAIAAIVLAAVFALFAWLTQYPVARVIFLVLDVLAVLGALSGLGRAQGFGFLGLVSLAVDVAYGGALVMSLLPRAHPAYG
jgi:hypothetical protein